MGNEGVVVGRERVNRLASTLWSESVEYFSLKRLMVETPIIHKHKH